MRTDELVAMLAAGDVAVDRRLAARRLAIGAGAGVAVSAALMAGLMGVRDLARDFAEPMLWIKFGYVAALAAVMLVAVDRLGRPGRRLGALPIAAAAVFVAIATLALLALARAAPLERRALVMGQTWDACPINIALLALPVFIGVLWALRAMAPTRLRLAGAGAGLFAGAAGAFVYCFHCPELAAPFLATWYAIGMFVLVPIGALIGPRVLRW